ncbi:hypothetical protein [Microbacterium sp. MMO-56]|uniref:hypothetical protein n=1 Tax=Microbacterium sp. MMO-56 TaxID=3081281 RepID=UPI0030183697
MTCTWGEALLLVESFESDPGSLLGAARAGWAWPASVSEIASTLLAQSVLSALMPAGESVTFPMPWDAPPAQPEPVAPEVVDEMRDRLARYSALPD